MNPLGSIPFIEADGGPFIAVPSRVIPLWEGIDHPRDGRVIEVAWQCDPSGPATDYDRACASNELLSAIPVGSKRALVFQAMTESIGWAPFRGADIGGIFVTQLSVDDQAKCEEEIYRLMTVDFGPAIASWELREAGGCLFHAAQTGARLDADVLALDLPAGRFEIQVLHYDVRAIAEMVLYKLVVAGTSHPMALAKNDTAAAAASVTRFFDAAAGFSLENWMRIHARYAAAKDEYWESTCALGGIGTSAVVRDDQTLTREERDARYALRAALSPRIDHVLADLPDRVEVNGNAELFRRQLRGIVTNTFQILWCRDQVMERPDRLAAAHQYLTLYAGMIDFPELG
jgi:hypothetical protein